MPKKRNKRYVHDLTCPKGHPDEAYFETCNCGATELNKGLKMAKSQVDEVSKVSLDDLVPDNKTGPLNKKEIKLVREWIDADWESADVDYDVLRLIKRLLTTCEDLENVESVEKDGD